MPKITRRSFLQRSVAAAVLTSSLSSCGRSPESSAEPVSSAFDEFLDFDTLELANLVRTRQVSQLELVETVIRRIEAINPTINFMTNRFYERARERAGQIPSDAPFAGVPLLLKDMADLGGMPRTDGSNFPPGNIPQHSAMYVDGLERAGFNFLGMTNVSEHAGVGGTDNIRFGATRNPWNLDYYPFMSSGGTAASVAAGVLSMAHGTDGAGSNRLPSSVTGLLGMKPTRYRMLADSHDGSHDIAKTNQMISRTVKENAVAFLHTQDPGNGLFPEEPLFESASTRRLKIGVAFENPGLVPVSEEIRSATENSVQLMEDLGHDIVEVDYPITAEEILVNYTNFFAGKTGGLKTAIESATGKAVTEAGVLSPFVAGSLQANASVTADEIAAALAFLEAIEPVFDTYFEDYDILLTPVSPTAGLRIDEIGADTPYDEESLQTLIGSLKFTGAINFAGCPAMSVPLNWDSKAGLPIGTHCVAAQGADRTLYELAYELEEARPWRNKWAPHSLKSMAK
ncbi:MAG: amidase [Woeseiaceae bacterium]